MSRSLLAHVVSKFAPREWENIATESLHYLLERPGADSAMGQLLGPAGFVPGPLRWRTQVSEAADSSRPDLVGEDENRRAKLLIEVKFWASLTENQPLGYLERQVLQFPNSPESHLLVFLAPVRRLPLLKAELERRLGSRGEEVAPGQWMLERDGRRVFLVSWAQVLAQLQVSLHACGDEAGLDDLRQLTGLCDRADEEAMLPIAQEEIDAGRGHRFFEFCDLVDRTADRLISEGLVDSKGLRSAAGKGWYCRYLRHTASGHIFGIGVYSWSWGNTYPSPWWIKFYNAEPSVEAALEHLHNHPLLPFIGQRDSRTEVAMQPPGGKEDHDAVMLLADAVRAVCEALPFSGEALISQGAEAVEVAARAESVT